MDYLKPLAMHSSRGLLFTNVTRVAADVSLLKLNNKMSEPTHVGRYLSNRYGLNKIQTQDH